MYEHDYIVSERKEGRGGRKGGKRTGGILLKLCLAVQTAFRRLVYMYRHDYMVGGRSMGEGRGEGGVTQFVHGRSRMTIDPRIPTMPGRSTSGFHQPGRHCLHQARSAVRCSTSHMKSGAGGKKGLLKAYLSPPFV